VTTELPGGKALALVIKSGCIISDSKTDGAGPKNLSGHEVGPYEVGSRMRKQVHTFRDYCSGEDLNFIRESSRFANVLDQSPAQATQIFVKTHIEKNILTRIGAVSRANCHSKYCMIAAC
jgi:hypothetical protein